MKSGYFFLPFGINHLPNFTNCQINRKSRNSVIFKHLPCSIFVTQCPNPNPEPFRSNDPQFYSIMTQMGNNGEAPVDPKDVEIVLAQ